MMSLVTTTAYFKARAEAERAASAAASCPEARHAHEQLAVLYSQMAETGGEARPAAERSAGTPRLVILGDQ